METAVRLVWSIQAASAAGQGNIIPSGVTVEAPAPYPPSALPRDEHRHWIGFQLLHGASGNRTLL